MWCGVSEEKRRLCPLCPLCSAVQMSPFPIQRSVKPALRGLWEQWKHRRCVVWEVWFGQYSFSTGNGLNTRREEQSRPSVERYCGLILLKITRAPDPFADERSWAVERCQQRRFIGPQYISHSPEIWDRYRAWLESWIPKWPCTSGGMLPSNPVVCLQPSMPSPCSLSQSAFVYISWIDQRLSQDNHQLHKESHGGDSSLHDGCVQHLKPYGLGFDSVRCGLACLDFMSGVFSCFVLFCFFKEISQRKTSMLV